MDIHSAESHLDKVNQYLEDLMMNPKIYSKTKLKLKSLSNELFRGIDLISKILMEESLATESGFETKVEADLTSTVAEFALHSQETTDRANELKEFTTASLAVAVQTKDSHRKRSVISKYGRVLSSVAKASVGQPSVIADCAKMLSRWYNLRFFEAAKRSNNFHYNIRQIKSWIEYIVVAYGSYVTLEDSDTFFNIMNNWCDKLATVPHEIPYALPLDIFEIGRSTDKVYATHTAMCVWDVLFDLGLDKLSSPDLQECAMSKFAICDKFSTMNPDIVDSYTYSDNNTQLFKQYKII